MLDNNKSLSSALYTDLLRGGSHRLPPIFEPHRLEGVVYTAFDGDDFYLTDLFSIHAFSLGWVPLNPEAFLGYKQAVDALHTKGRVLAADVALLARADALWIYTAQSGSEPRWSNVAEGVLIETLYYLALSGASDVFFVDIVSLMSGGPALPVKVTVSVEGLRDAISATHPDILKFVDGLLLPSATPPVVTALYSMADSKNAHWLREWMLSQGWAPVVPTLAFPSGVTRGVHDLANAWLCLAKRSDLILALGDVASDRPDSRFVALAHAELSNMTILRGNWAAVGAPKAVKGSAWPISAYERNALVSPTSRSRDNEGEL